MAAPAACTTRRNTPTTSGPSQNTKAATTTRTADVAMKNWAAIRRLSNMRSLRPPGEVSGAPPADARAGRSLHHHHLTTAPPHDHARPRRRPHARVEHVRLDARR